MEVHHHAHTDRKKWTHYFWEFLMLFLAVTLGFFVENQREHFIENKREKEYIRSLIIDLKKDTANAMLHLRRNIQRFHGLDSLGNLLNREGPIDSTITSRLYYLSKEYTRNISKTITNEITIQQLLNSGNVRLLRRKGVYDRLVEYQLKKQLLLNSESVYEQMVTRIALLNEDIFRMRGYREIIMKSDTTFPRSYKEINLHLMTTDRTKIIKYAELVETYRAVVGSYTSTLNVVKNSATHLLLFLKKEYDLD